MSRDGADLDIEFEGEPLEVLQAVWEDKEMPLGHRARALSRYLQASRMTLEGASRYLGAPPAELEALVGLAMLEDEDLVALSKAKPPKTTWLFFASADSDEVAAGLRALESSQNDEIAAERVYEAMRQVGGPTVDDRVAAISGRTLAHVVQKAKQYDVLSPKTRGVLVSCAKRKQLGTPLSEKQLDALKGILKELIERGVICADSPDNDPEECDEVLKALGMG